MEAPNTRSILPTAILLMLIGWGGLYSVVFYTSPTGGSRFALFFTLVLAVTGTALPLIAFLNRRFASTPPATPSIIVRQALWIGVYPATLAWLQVGRVLTPAIALLLAVGFLIIESLLRLRERAQRQP